MHSATAWSKCAAGRACAGGTREWGWYRRSVANQHPLEVKWLGRIAYREAWEMQHELVATRRADEIPISSCSSSTRPS